MAGRRTFSASGLGRNIGRTGFRIGEFREAGSNALKAGTYTIKVGEPGTERIKTLKGVQSIDFEKSQTVEVNF